MNFNVNWCGGVYCLFCKHKIISIRHTIMVVISFMILASNFSKTYGTDGLDDARLGLINIIEAIKTIEYPVNGRGSVLLQVKDYTGKHEKIAKFVFKDKLSRTDMFESVDGKKGDREVCWSVGREYSVGYNQFNAVVSNKPQEMFYNKFGFDFRIDSFLTYLETPISEELEALVKGPAKISLNLNKNEILKITVDYQDERVHEHRIISLDKTKGYRPVYFKDTMQYLKEPERNHTTTRTIEWEKNNTNWYVKSAEHEEDAWVTIPDATPPVINKPYKKQIKLSITEFHQDEKISDDEFTLKALQIPANHIVLDRVTGVTYRYGYGLKDTDVLESLLEEAEFTKLIEKQAIQDANNITVKMDQDGYHNTMIDHNDASSENVSIAISRAKNYYNIIITVTSVSVLILLLIITYKYIMVRKNDKKTSG